MNAINIIMNPRVFLCLACILACSIILAVATWQLAEKENSMKKWQKNFISFIIVIASLCSIFFAIIEQFSIANLILF